MAFPGNYDISYYKGDTLEFRIYPKDASGTVFSLTGYDAAFTISTAKGSAGASSAVSGIAQIVDDTYLLCVITPTVGDQLVAGTTYVYDVEISNLTVDPASYDKVYTLLAGSISITDQVTGAEPLGSS